MISKTERKLAYPTALILSNSKRKTFESLGLELKISGDTISRLVTENVAEINDLIRIAQKIFCRKKVYLLIDDTLILKVYSRFIEGTSDNYSSSDKRVCRSLNSVVAMITDGITAIPISQEIWTSREFDKKKYRKKWELAQQLILEIRQHISLGAVIMDGLYAVAEFMDWLDKNQVLFEMRFHSNSRVKLYGYRWNIEKFFRTAKQKLGLNDCQSRKFERQKGHIVNVFIAYIVAQYERVKQKLRNVKMAIKSIISRNLKNSNYAIQRFREIFRHV